MRNRRRSEIIVTAATKAVAEPLESRVLLSAVSLVDNINKVTDSSNPSNFVVAGNELFFTANDGIHGPELWKSDGTSDGTVMVADLVPGSTGSGAQPFAAMGNDVFFTTTSGGLYISDGTAGGTVQLSTVTPNVSNWTVYAGRLYFQGTDAGHGSELWTSDGTAAGTNLIADIASGTDSSSPSDLVALNGAIYFAANTSTSGNELWKTDGSTAGTTLVADINPGTGSSNPTALATMNNKLYFIASSSGATSNLYVSDGTAAGTSEVSTVPAVGLASNSTLSVVGSTLYFLGTDATHGQELWKSDGTAAGTVFFYDLTPGTGSTTSISTMYSMNGAQYFWTYSASSNQSQFWRTDGTGSGTSTFLTEGEQFGANVVVGNYLFFMTAGSFPNLFRTDGTKAGTSSFATSPSSLQENLVDLNGTLLFNGYIGGPNVAFDSELLGVLPGAAQSAMIKNINTQMPYGSNLQYFVRAGNQAYFVGNDGSTTTRFSDQLWVTDGTEGGTRVVASQVVFPVEMAPLGNSLLFFSLSNPSGGTWQFWKTDGTPGGTVMVEDFGMTDPSFQGVSSVVTAGKLAYFVAGDNSSGTELWVTDGTRDGTHVVVEINAGTASSSPNHLTAVGNELYFDANDGIHGTELWKSDGTAQGTVLVDDATLGSGSSSFNDLTDVAGTLYFMMTQAGGTANLWKSDGTSAGTVQLTNAAVQPIESFEDVVEFQDQLYFTSNTPAHVVQVWKTDGTPAGTQIVNDLIPGSGISSPDNLLTMGGSLYFTAPDSNGLGQLFKTDGTAAGTIQLTHGLTLSPDNPYAYHGVLPQAEINGTLYFLANDGVHGEQLWASDGTPDGTAMVPGINPTGAFIYETFSMGSYLLLHADDQKIGDELWRTDAPPAPVPGSISGTVFYDTNGNGLQDSGEQAFPSWGVYLDTNADGVYEPTEPEVNCDSSGNYTFTDVLPGIYRVRPVRALEWTETAPSGGTQVVNVSASQAVANIDFGEVRGSIQEATSINSATAIFTGDLLSLAFFYTGFDPVTSWTFNWGDGSPLQTVSGGTLGLASHTFDSVSGRSPFAITAWATTVDGTTPSAPVSMAVYTAPTLLNGVLAVSGTSGNDIVTLTNVSGTATVQLNRATRQYNSSLFSRMTYTDAGGNDYITLNGAFASTLNLTSGNNTVVNNDTSPVSVSSGTGKTTINANSGTTIIPANNGTGIQRVDFAAINISAGAKVVFATSSATLGDYSNHANRSVVVVDAGGLNIAIGGALDLGDNDLILNYAFANQSATRSLIAGLVTSGYDVNKDFSGTGITSSEANYDATQSGGTRAIGWGDDADLGKTSFDGVTLSSTNEMLVKFTYYGDSNLDGIVDTGGDLALFAKGFHGQGSGWDFGDYNYDGATNNPDLSLYARGLNNGYRIYGAL